MNFKQGIRTWNPPSDSAMPPFPSHSGLSQCGKDLTVSEAVLISLTNLTSAGQFAGLYDYRRTWNVGCDGFVPVHHQLQDAMLMWQLHYRRKSMTASKESGAGFSALPSPMKSLPSAIQNPGKIKPNCFMGLTIIPIIGWTLGTLGGALLGNILPAIIHKRIRRCPLRNALSLLSYQK